MIDMSAGDQLVAPHKEVTIPLRVEVPGRLLDLVVLHAASYFALVEFRIGMEHPYPCGMRMWAFDAPHVTRPPSSLTPMRPMDLGRLVVRNVGARPHRFRSYLVQEVWE
jgi:hypothetical protein